MFKIIGFTHFWLQNVTQDLIMNELDISRHTAVDWSMFCREVTYDGMIVHKNKIGGFGKEVEIGRWLYIYKETYLWTFDKIKLVSSYENLFKILYT